MIGKDRKFNNNLGNLNLTLIIGGIEQVHLGKDVFLFPYYLGKRLGMDVHIAYLRTSDNVNMPTEYRNVKLHPVSNALSGSDDYSAFKSYLEQHAREIDLLMLFHQESATEKMCILYKTLNKSGRCYVKLDMGAQGVPAKTRLKRNVFKLIRNILQSHKFCKLVDYVSVETTDAFEKIQKSKAVHLAFGNKLHFHSNGFDEEMLEEMGLKVNDFFQKENLIITVGSLGTPPKNTSMLLNALKHVELKDWKVVFIGSVTPEFEDEVKSFFREYPDKQNQVSFTGVISDKRVLWDYYNRAKVFCLTSLWESFALVLTEAYRFGDYIVTTPVGAYYDVAIANNVGECVPQKDSQALACSLQNIIDGTTDIDVYKDEKMRQKFSMSRIVNEFDI